MADSSTCPGSPPTRPNLTLFRRAKLWLNAIPTDVIDSALESGVLVGRLGLTDGKGNPLCASVRPPLIEWSAGRAS